MAGRPPIPLDARQRARAMEKFLPVLARTGNVSAATDAAGVSRTTMDSWRAQDAEFAKDWAEALEVAVDALEAEARRRGMEGVERYVVQSGGIVNDPEGRPMKIREYSDTLLLAQLKAYRHAYRDKHTIDGSMTLSLEKLILSTLQPDPPADK